MKISIRKNDYLIRMRKWEYRIFITCEGYWKAERRRITWLHWENFDQNKIPVTVAREAVKYWGWMSKTY